MEEQEVIGPCSLKQQLVLQDDSTDTLLIGGGAGGGKSYMALVKALKYVQDPQAIVLIVRLSYPLLKSAGGLVSESKQLYSKLGAIWKEQKLEWHWPNGAIIKFYAMPQDLSELQGQAFTNVIVDEGAEFQFADILALRARLRGARYKGKLNMMITANPSRTSWLYDFVEYSLDEDGVPKPGTENIIRWYIVLNGKVHWAESPEELYEKHGHGYTLGKDFIPLSWRFIPMDIYSNPVLLKNNPQYLADLMSQSRVNMLRFLKGSWTARSENSGVFNRDWVRIVDHPPANAIARVRSWDLAGSVPSESNPNPDWTAGVKISKDATGTFYVEDVKRFRKLTDGVLKEIIATAQDDGPDTKVTLPRDPGAGAKVANQFFTRVLAEAGIPSKSITVSGHSSKAQRFAPFCSVAESGSICVVRGPWLEDYLCELEYFEPGNRNLKDDQLDATSDAFNELCKSTTLPSFKIPELSQSSPIPTI